MITARMPDLDRDTQRRLAAGLYAEVWRLLDLPNRRPEQDDEMLHAAHASRYLWGKVGDPVTLARRVALLAGLRGTSETFVGDMACPSLPGTADRVRWRGRLG
jgi:hypothetical protein